MRGVGRRGGAYVLVLGVTTMAAVMGVGAVLAQRVQFQARELVEHTQTARIAAVAGLEMAMQAIDENEDWRETLLAQPVFPAVAINGIEVTVTATAPDGTALTLEDLADPIMLSATAQIDTTRQRFSVVLEPTIEPKPELRAALSGAQLVKLEERASIRSEAPLWAFEFDANKAVIAPDVWFVKEAKGEWYNGASRSVASAPSVLAADIANAALDSPTIITPAVLPESDGRFWLTGALGPGVNSAGGSANANGVYHLRAAGEKIGIRNLRLMGTLVVSDYSGEVLIDGSNNLSSGNSGRPVLVVDDNLDVQMRSGPVDERLVGRSLNPPGMPDANGVTDADTADSYASLITGAVVVGDRLRVYWPGMWLEGSMLVAGNVEIKQDAMVRMAQSEALLASPPDGLRSSSGLRINPATWTRVAE